MGGSVSGVEGSGFLFGGDDSGVEALSFLFDGGEKIPPIVLRARLMPPLDVLLRNRRDPRRLVRRRFDERRELRRFDERRELRRFDERRDPRRLVRRREPQYNGSSTDRLSWRGITGICVF